MNFTKVTKERPNFIKNGSDLFANLHIIWNIWKKHFSQVLKVDALSDNKQTEIYNAENIKLVLL
jgi:hypothetical protein